MEVRSATFEKVSPEFSGVRLRWRSSFRGGRVTAQPAATAQQLQQNKRAALGKEHDSHAHVVEVGAAGPKVFDSEDLTLASAGLLVGRGAVLQKAESSALAGPGDWQPIEAFTGSGPSGRMRVHLHSEQELSQEREMLHSRAAQAGLDTVAHGHGGGPGVWQARSSRQAVAGSAATAVRHSIPH